MSLLFMPAIITQPRPLEERTISAASTVAQLLERATCRPAKMDGTQAGRIIVIKI